MEETKRVTGIEEFKAVTHPLRVRLLAHLRHHGPATATELARVFATDTGSTSYHLRKLAEFGFVSEVAVQGGHPRARRWEARHKTTSWSNADFAGTPEGREVSGVMRRRQLEVLTDDLNRLEDRLGELPKEWAEVLGLHGDLVFRLTSDTLHRIMNEFSARLTEAAEQDSADPAAATVAVYFGAMPR